MMNLDQAPAWAWMISFLLCLGGVLLWELSGSMRRSRFMEGLAEMIQFPPISEPAIRPPFALDDGISGLLFADNRLIVVDLREGGTVVQRLSLDQVAALKIYETKLDRIPFRLVTQGRSETRRIETSAVAALGQLMEVLTACGARIEYVPEEG